MKLQRRLLVSLTGVKASVTIRLDFVPPSNPPDASWTAFRYQAYSFVLPA